MQKVCPTKMPSGSVCTRKRFRPRNGFSPQNDQSLKTTIGADAELRLPIWHCGMREAFLIHVSSALNEIGKRGTFKAYKEAHEAYVEQQEATKEAKVNMQLFVTAASKGENAVKKGTEKSSEEASGKNRSEKEKGSQKTNEGVATADATAPDLRAEYKAVYEKATHAKETAKIQRNAAATKIFQFYANLLSSDVKYAWNKIVWEQMEADPYKDLQGMSKKGPRGLMRESFDECVMFHLLTVFPNNAAEQEYITFPTCSRSPSGWRTPVRTAHRAAQCLRCAATLMVLQPTLRHRHDSGKRFFH